MTTAWQSRAACIGSGLDWFPLQPDPEYAAKVAACRRVCVSCPVVADCLEYAMTIPPRLVAGVLAGMTQSARYKAQDAAEVPVAAPRPPAISHGTERGYAQHKRHGIYPIDNGCLSAHAAYIGPRSERRERVAR